MIEIITPADDKKKRAVACCSKCLRTDSIVEDSAQLPPKKTPPRD